MTWQGDVFQTLCPKTPTPKTPNTINKQKIPGTKQKNGDEPMCFLSNWDKVFRVNWYRKQTTLNRLNRIFAQKETFIS